MSKIRIFVDGHWFDQLYESTGVFIRGLYSRLAKDDDFEILMGAFYPDRLRNAFDQTDRIQYIQYQSKSKYYRLAYNIPAIVKRHRIDIAHFQYTSPLFKRCAEIVTIHDILFKDFPGEFPWSYRITKDILFRRSARRADLVTTVSTYSRDAIARHYGIQKSSIEVVPNGVGSEFFDVSSSALVQEKFGLDKYILYISRFEPRKNHYRLLQAYLQTELWNENIYLVLVGRVDIPVDDFDSLLNSLPSEMRRFIVRFEKIAFPDLLALYKNASLCVYASMAEGFGIPPLESAAMRTKTLCSNQTAMRDFDFFGEDLFDPYDVNGLAAKIKSKLRKDDWAQRDYISNSIRLRFSWDDIAAAFGEKIKSICKKS